MNIKTAAYQVKNLNRINILLGKNGVGKSTIFKNLLGAENDTPAPIHAEYVTPERGGFLKYEAGVDNAITTDPSWIPTNRSVNQSSNFKQQTISRYQALEMDVLRLIEETTFGGAMPNANDYFQSYIDTINSLLENIEIKRIKGEKSFKIYKKGTDNELNPQTISSGESELISLAIECLSFQKRDSVGKEKILLLDEPDVHLHPDLQVKFMRFIHKLSVENGSEFRVIIATHSTAFLGAIEKNTDVNVAFIVPNSTIIEFNPISDIYKEFLPVFGAHPLSNVFNEAPVLLVEGEDDERIWQQAVRTSNGKVKIYPCVCGDIHKIGLFEKEVKKVINSIYDNAKAYSLRDRDGGTEDDLPDDLPIIKLKLKCYSAENLILTNEVLESLGYTWETLQAAMNEWIAEKTGKSHPQLEEMKNFQQGGYDRKSVKIKDLRMLLIGIMGSNKSWEIIVGKKIAQLSWSTTTDYTIDGSVYNYLGQKLVENILPKA